MKPLEKKAIKQAINSLKDIDLYDMASACSKEVRESIASIREKESTQSIDSLEIEEVIKRLRNLDETIITVYYALFNKIDNNQREAKEWLNTLLEES